MKFVVERDSLLAALSHAHRIVARTDAILILCTVLIAAEAGCVRLKATSTEIVAETSCSADVQDEGQAAVPLAPLVDLLRKLPAGTTMSFAQVEPMDELQIKYRRSSIALPTLSAHDFVTFEMENDPFAMEIEGAKLARLLEVPSHIADAQSPWAFGVGVHLHVSADQVSLVGVATDQKRLTRVVVEASRDAAALPPITLALKPLAEIVKLARDAGTGTVTVQITERLLSASSNGTMLTSKLVEARFPPYAQVFPTEMPLLSVVAAGELTAALQRTLILADDKDRVVRCSVADGILSMNSRSQKGGAISESIEAEGGDGMSFGMNATMAIEALAAIGSDVVEIASANPMAPIVMRARNSAEVTCLVMPWKG